MIAGDFNIHVEKTSDPAGSDFRDLIASFDCVQNVLLEPTHRDGGTIDLVITKSDQTSDNLKIDPPDVISDHSLVSWHLPFHQHPPITSDTEVRSWKQIDKDGFRAALLNSELCREDCHPESVNDFFSKYHDVLRLVPTGETVMKQ